MRKVLAIIHTPVYGGPHNQIYRLYEPLRREGWEYVAVLPQEDGDGAARLRSIGIRVHQIPLHRLRAVKSLKTQWNYARSFPKDVRRLRAIMIEECAEAVQICGLMHPQGALAAAPLGVPVVWQLLSTFAPWPLRLALAPLVRRHAAIIMSTGRSVFEQHPGLGGAVERLVVFYPPVEVARVRRFREEREWARRFLEAPEGTPVVGTLGNRNRQKSHDVLRRAATILRRRGTPCVVRIVGRDTPTQRAWYERRVRRPAAAAGLFENGFLRIVDPEGEGPRMMAGFDVFVLSSRAEGVPTAALEAMSLGLPVVATRVGAFGEIVENGVEGWLVPPGDATALADRIEALVKNPLLRKRLGEAAFRRVRDRFDIGQCAAAHIQAFERALQRRPAHSRS